MPLDAIFFRWRKLPTWILCGALFLGAGMMIGCGERSSEDHEDGASQGRGRVIILGLDGVDPEVLEDLLDEGGLPNFRRLRDQGVLGPLISEPPLLSPVIWTTIATGRRPLDHGITDFVTEGSNGERLPVTSQMRRKRALWNIVGEGDESSVGVVGWWATWPAEEVSGAILSDRANLHFLLADETQGLDLPGLMHPPRLVDEIGPLLRSPESIGMKELKGFAQIEADELDRPFDFEDPLGHLRWAIAAAHSHAEIGEVIWDEMEPDLLMVYIEEVDTVCHLFGHLHRTEDWAGELAEQKHRFGGAVEAAYQLADSIVGQMLELADENTTLIVISDHGFAVGEIPEDPTLARDLRGVSHEAHRIEGIVGLWGRGVRAGSRLEGASILDVTPTVLALLGRAPSEEMPGRVWDEGFSISFPALRIPSYESEGVGRASSDRSGIRAQDEELLRKLEALGYLGGEGGPASIASNEAVLALQEGQYRRAARDFQRLLKDNPQDAALHNGLGAAWAGLDRDQAAMQSFDRALSLDPLHIVALFNRGLLHERRGEIEQAVQDFRSALRYDSDHAPSRQALTRLGQPSAPLAASAAEEKATKLLREIQYLARRGNYVRALELLEEAERATPDAAVIFQYRANISFLNGDREGAVRALRKALELEPDNELFRKNLERLLGEEGTS